MFASKAGAKLVHVCLVICDLAEELIKSNDLQDYVQVINKCFEYIEKFDEIIDIII
jgi:hypothetical protein